jgi:hypothetical protein
MFLNKDFNLPRIQKTYHSRVKVCKFLLNSSWNGIGFYSSEKSVPFLKNFFKELNRFFHKTYIWFIESCAKLKFPKKHLMNKEMKVLFRVTIKGLFIKRA